MRTENFHLDALYKSNIVLLFASQAVDTLTIIQAALHDPNLITNGEFPIVAFSYAYLGIIGIPIGKIIATNLMFLVAEGMKRNGGIRASTWGLRTVNIFTTFAAVTNELAILSLL